MVVPNAQEPLEEGGTRKDILTQFIRGCLILTSNINPEIG